ncbi:DNA-binding transcriptional regulator, IclR family [Prauserella marina]|uniref:DNA-binding transcriptional regulator, IclR family n=2 Tax=Prauserella marina TaxID=530584 RepID=A0A1G6LNV0_9PSEU|nr:IclR family transcriptional regulator [Prauserella marina]SDC44849.1 DNA-binding transcriptional regulator, IclR family [Prauserella marina]
MARNMAGDTVLSRVARVLNAFEHDRRVLTVAQLARRAELPVPTTHRLVGQLLDVGFLERDGKHGIKVGMRLWQIAINAPGARELREAAMPFLEDVHAATQQHTFLDVREGTEVLIIERLKAHNAFGRILLTPGMRVSSNAVAGSLILLAHAPRDVQEAALSAPLRKYNSRTPVKPAQLRDLWASARRNGYIVCDGYVDPDALSIAVPVPGPDNTVVAALGVIVPSQHAQPMNHLPVLFAAARGISRELSRTPPPGPTRMLSYLVEATPEN